MIQSQEEILAGKVKAVKEEYEQRLQEAFQEANVSLLFYPFFTDADLPPSRLSTVSTSMVFVLNQLPLWSESRSSTATRSTNLKLNTPPSSRNRLVT